MTHASIDHRPRLLAGALTLSLVVAACSSGGSDGVSPTTTSGTKTSTTAHRSTTTTTPDGGDGLRTKPLGAQPDGETLPPVHLQTESTGPADVVPPSLRQGIRAAAPARATVPSSGPTKLTGTTGAGWHTIDRTPPKTAGGKGSSDSYPGGTRREYDLDDDTMTQWNPDGSLDADTPDGLIHVGPQGDVSNGSYDDQGGYTESYPDGGSAHVGPGGDYYQDPDGTRTTYDGDGGSTEIPLPTYADPPGPPGKAPSGGIGEPHYLTEDGTDVTSQVLGEFVLSTGVRGQEVQARTQPWKRSPTAAAITALAFGVGEQRVQVDVDGTVLVDGKAAPHGTAQEFGFDAGGAAGVWRDRSAGPATAVVVVWPDLSQARVTFHDGWLSVDLQWREATGDRAGVLGSDDGDPTNDRTDRDGRVRAADETDQLVRSWQLTDDESLFTYASGLHTADYIDPDFPSTAPEPDLAAGTKACAEVPEGFARDACAYDVGLTGVDAWVDPAAAFGTRMAGDASLRASVAALATRLAAVVAGTAGDPEQPRLGTGITLSSADRSGATALGDDLAAAADLEGTGSMTYSFDVATASELTAQSNDLACPGAAYVAGKAAYAFFDEAGTVVSGPRLACDDDPDAAELEPGTYYLKLVGPGAVDVKVVLFTAD